MIQNSGLRTSGRTSPRLLVKQIELGAIAGHSTKDAMAKKDHSSLLTVHERKGSNTVKRKQGFRKYDGNIDVTNFRRQRTTAVNIKENAKLAVCMTILFLLCLICAVLEINSPEFSYQSWLALFGILSMLLALIMEYPVCQSFLALTAYTLIFQLSTNEVVVSGIGSPSILAVGLFQPFCRVIDDLGVIESILNRVLGRSRSVYVSFLRMALAVSVMSSMLSNTALVLIGMPMVINWTRSLGFPENVLLVYLSYFSQFGGMLTLLGTSTNLVIQNEAEKVGIEIGMFTTTPVAFACLISGIITSLLHMFFVNTCRKKKEPVRESFENVLARDLDSSLESAKHGISLPYTIMFHYTFTSNAYSLNDLSFNAAVHDGAKLVKLTRRKSGTGGKEIEQNIITTGNKLLAEKLHPKDVITVNCTAEGSASLRRLMYLGIYEQQKSESSSGIVLTTGGRSKRCLFEVIPSSQCKMIGRQTAASFNFSYQIFILAVSSGNLDPAEGSDRIHAGDLMLVEANVNFALDWKKGFMSHFQSVRPIMGSAPPKRGKSNDRKKKVMVVFISLLLLVLITLNYYSIFFALGAGLSIFGAMGVIDLKRAYGAVNVDVMVTLCLSIPMAAMVERHNLDKPLARGISFLLSLAGGGEYFFLILTYLSCCILTNAISNTAAALLCWEIFLSVAKSNNFSVLRLAVVLMIGASSAFLSPVGYQTNLFVQIAAKDLKNIEFFQLGVPLVVVLTIVCPTAAMWLI